MDDTSGNAGHGDAARMLRRLTFGALLPAWLGASMLDWWWHRVTRIEETAGARESALHLAMMAEVGTLIALPLVFELDGRTIGAMALLLAAHEATAMWDVLYATPRRPVAPREQHTHSVLEVMPPVVVACAALVHRHQAAAHSDARGPFGLRLRDEPGSRRATFGTLFAIGTCAALPYLEEFVRCMRARPSLERTPIPDEPPVAERHRWAREHDAEGYEA